MAESILFDIAGEIILKLGSGAVREIALWWGVQAEIDKLNNTVSTIRAVLLDAEQKQGQSEQVKDWLRKLKYAMYDAEDLLDDFSTEALQRQTMDGCRLTKEVRRFFSRSNQFAYGLKMGHKIKSLRERLAGINADRQFHLEVGNLGETRTVMGKMDRQTDSVIPEVVIGREEDKKAVVKLLLDSSGGEGVSVVPIVGIGGLGKTTLAQLIFNDQQIKACFELTMWTCVSDDFEVHTIVKNILESATKEKQESLQTSVLIDHLRKTISGKKFLLVLDDVWNENGEKWDRLKKLLMGGASGSKILLTTRSEKVAEITSRISPYMLEGLSKDDSWLLFKQYAFHQAEGCKGPRLEKIGREIVSKCVGVPLAIKTIGRVLYFMNTEAEWLAFNDNQLSRVGQNDDVLMPTLKLSYDHLPSHLKRCFAFCSLFPKDHLIDVETLINLWVAEGFVIGSSHSGGCIEDLGHGYFMDLLWRCFFQEVTRDESGNVESCKMHDLMHDLACIVGGSESKTIDKNSGIVIDENVLHASVGYELIGERQIPFQLIGATRLRTFILPCQLRIRGSFFFGGYRWENSGLDIFSKFKSLRSLDLCGLEIEKLPAFIKKLKHLRYLNLSGNGKIKMLPDWITRLVNLQVLKLCGCKSLTELPKDIRKLKNLGCVDCRGCYALSHMPHGLEQLTSQWRLTAFVVGEGSVSSGASKHKYESSGLEELHGLNNLRGSLEIKNLGNVRNGVREFEAANLKGKNLLQSLDLDWGRRDWSVVDTDYEERCFQGLQPHPNLKGLFVDGYGGVRFPSLFSSLTNLVKITIYNCRKCQFLPPFHQFPSLQELRIWSLWELEYMVEDIDGESNNSESSSSSSSTLFFPSLKSLKLHTCPKLKGWWKNQGAKYSDDGTNSAATSSTSAATVPLKLPHFHRLSTLEIWRCPNLTQMPLFPSVTDQLQLEGSSLEPLRQTMEMKRSSTMATSSSSSSGTLVMHPPLSELKELLLRDIGDLETLPEEWLQNLTSLQELRIWDCPNLKSLPQGMKHHLNSLRRLNIRGCPQLEERCGNRRGADWPIISHIPNIQISGKEIQKDGRYLFDSEEEGSSC